jgi:hypothetical protein
MPNGRKEVSCRSCQTTAEKNALRGEHINQRRDPNAKGCSVLLPDGLCFKITRVSSRAQHLGIDITKTSQRGNAGELLQGSPIATVARRAIRLNTYQTGLSRSTVMARE